MLTPEQLWEKEKDFCEKYTGDCIRERDFIRIITKRDKLSSQLEPQVIKKITGEIDRMIIEETGNGQKAFLLPAYNALKKLKDKINDSNFSL